VTKKIFITAGGTGGHIFPAQSVANILAKDENYKVILLTDGRGQALKGFAPNIKVIKLPLSRSRSGLIKKLFFFASLFISCLFALLFTLLHRPKTVVGFGGFPSLPGLLSGVILSKIIKCKTIIHEQNAYLGKVNRTLQKWLDIIVTSFPEVQALNEKNKVQFIGPLVRNGFTEIGKKGYKAPTNDKPINILVTGGSQGAKVFSDCVPAACAMLPQDLRKRIHIIQQCRSSEIENTVKIYEKMRISYDVKTFIKDMPQKMEQAHFLICRSGASTVSEMIQSKRPGILVPYPYATDDHQRHNAKVLVDKQASWMILNKDLTADNLCKTMKYLLSSDKILNNAAKNLETLSVDKAAQAFADIIKKN